MDPRTSLVRYIYIHIGRKLSTGHRLALVAVEGRTNEKAKIQSCRRKFNTMYSVGRSLKELPGKKYATFVSSFRSRSIIIIASGKPAPSQNSRSVGVARVSLGTIVMHLYVADLRGGSTLVNGKKRVHKMSVEAALVAYTMVMLFVHIHRPHPTF